MIISDQDCVNKEDNELCALSLENSDYFACLIKRYEKKLLAYIRRISGLELTDAEDVLQEVFIKAYMNLNDFDLNLKFSSWIYRIAHNQTISNFRKSKSRIESFVIDLESGVLENFSSDLDSSELTNQKLNRDAINSVFKKMDIKYREVLILKFFEEKSYKEISDIIKKPEGTVATLISRAKKQFKKYLEAENLQLN